MKKPKTRADHERDLRAEFIAHVRLKGFDQLAMKLTDMVARGQVSPRTSLIAAARHPSQNGRGWAIAIAADSVANMLVAALQGEAGKFEDDDRFNGDDAIWTP